MDQVKVGKFIARLRKEQGLTQEALGEKLGVTNKTVSRWETGAYMPGIDMLEPLSGALHVSVHELLRGEPMEEENYRKEADAVLISVLKDSRFTFQEQMNYWKKKWKKDHWALILFCALFWAGLFLISCWKKIPWLSGLCPLAACVFYVYLRNRMMIYVENKVYDPVEDK